MAAAEPEADEFATMAAWTTESVLRLGRDHAVAAACRGSGPPAAMRWVVDHVLPRQRGGVVLDVGAGMGGPAALMGAYGGTRPLLVDPEPAACRAARTLFDLPAVAADAARLPLPDGAASAAWSLGVLCTVEDPSGCAREIRRVLRPGGRAGLLVYCCASHDLPEALLDALPHNHFPTAEGLEALLGAAGLAVDARAALASFAEPTPGWTARADAVRDDVRERHAHEAGWQAAQQQEDALGELLERGWIEGRLLVVS